MLTIFTVPKPFRGHISIIQRNAIRSWTLLQPLCEIILFGDEEGTAELAKEFGVRHIKEIACNDYGTPLLNDIFEKAHQETHNEHLCYVNADIILLQNFIESISSIPLDSKKFLMVGQRWDIDLNHIWNFSDNDWEIKLLELVQVKGALHPPSGSDYFVYPRELFNSIPPFAVGRAGWDNWMIYYARKNYIPVIDATGMALVVHQNHDYGHVKKSVDGTYENPESIKNREIIGDSSKIYTLKDADYKLTDQGLKKKIIIKENLILNIFKMITARIKDRQSKLQ